MPSRPHIFLAALCSASLLHAQPAIEWSKCLGGTAGDVANSTQAHPLGGYIVVGATNSTDGDVSGNHGGYDVWLMKLDDGGDLEWQHCYGGTGTDLAQDIRCTLDTGYILVGQTASNNGDVSGNHGGANDMWVVKLDATGTVEWQKCLGGSGSDFGWAIEPTADGGYVAAGYSGSTNGDVSGGHGGYDMWVVKLDGSGTIEWQKCLGGAAEDYARTIQQTADGGYVAAGATRSDDGDVAGHHGTTVTKDMWVVKLDGAGILQWQKCLGGTSHDEGAALCTLADGGYLVAGQSGSTDGDVSGGNGDQDVWCVKLDTTGTLEWQECLGGSAMEVVRSVRQVGVNSFMIAGFTDSNDGDVSGLHGGQDGWLVELDSTGTLQQQLCFGGSSDEWINFMQLTSDGGAIVAGNTDSNDGDVSGLHGADDAWVVKFAGMPTGSIEVASLAFGPYPNPTTGRIIVEGQGLRQVVVCDALGQPVHQQTSAGMSLVMDLERIPAGVYLVIIEVNDQRIAQRVLKQ